MEKKSVATWVVSRVLMLVSAVSLGACAESGRGEYSGGVDTPTVDYVEKLDVYSAPHKDSFLNQLAMNYRSYAIYNARTSNYPDMGELFAQKAVAAFSGEVPYPETLRNWPVNDDNMSDELSAAYSNLMDVLKDDASQNNPELAAEAQAKFDCWLSASSTEQIATANQCRERFMRTMNALRDCRGGKIVKRDYEQQTVTTTNTRTVKRAGEQSTWEYYPETRSMISMNGADHSRDGIIVVNNVNLPEHLINPVSVQSVQGQATLPQPMIFNQNIYGGDKSVNDSRSVSNSNNNVALDGGCQKCQDMSISEPDVPCECDNDMEEEITIVGEELVTRREFIDMMMVMRQELAAINAKLDKLEMGTGEKTMIKVQQIPLEPKQHVMEEVFEVRFDFDKAIIKPEYQNLIRQLVDATQSNKNIKVSVVGHTDTAGSKKYNYALGGRRAEAVQKMLINYGIPANQIVAVSAGEEDLKVPTPDGTPNAENRRVRVVKETSYTEPAGTMPVANVVVEEYSSACDGFDCD